MLVILAALLFNLVFVFFAALSTLYLLVFIGFAVSLSVIAPFLDIPAMKKSGKIEYLSPMFLAEKEQKGVIVIHGGTLFDYWFLLEKNWSGSERKKFIIKNYLEGLLNLIENYKDSPQHIKIKGTSYILNPRTANKMGFTEVKKDFLQQIILTYNYFNLLISSSLANKRLEFPNLKEVRTYEAAMNDLVRREHDIRNLYQKI